jgi:uncharacterized membrane protein
MSDLNLNPNEQPATGQPVPPPVTEQSIGVENLGEQPAGNYQRMADAAGRQMNEAADALRRGELMRDAVVDPAADSDDKLVAMLSYVVPVLLPAIVLLSESSKKRPFQRYHAVQSLGLAAFLTVIGFAVAIVSSILMAIPVVGFLVGVAMFCLTPIAFLAATIAFFYYGYQAYQGRRFTIPAVTSFLANQGWI